MFIYDLTFINSCEEEFDQDNCAIKGGASAKTTLNIMGNSDAVFAMTSALGTGDYSKSLTNTGARLIAPKNYQGQSSNSVAYGSGYGTAYGVDRYSSVASDLSFGSSFF